MKLEVSDYPKLLVRQVVVVSTISESGISNAAPFSFNSPISFSPPLYGFSSNPNHHTWKNIQKNGEFVVNVVGSNFGGLMEVLETPFDYEVSEIEKAGLTEEKAEMVKPPRIAEANAWMECKLNNSVILGDHVWVVGEVVCTGVKDDLWTDEAVLDLKKANALCHMGGKFFASDSRIKEYNRAQRK
ncbi:MAG: flavin reductase family protein [Halobacteriota archaeon]|nr:flavin reductase family protein [Halobacteriota archaeon]